MQTCFFHCTDGYELHLDREGADALAEDETRSQASASARNVMRKFGVGLDYSEWVVAIYNDRGEQINTITFADLELVEALPLAA